MDIKPRTADSRSPNYTGYMEWPLNPVEAAPTDGKQVKVLLDDLPSAEVAEATDFDDEPLIWNQADLDAAFAEQPGRGGRTGEEQIQAAILHLMSDGEVWMNAELKRAIPTLVALSVGDRQRSPSRPREEKWEELVNNALTQTGRSNSLYAQGLVVNVGFGRHRLSNQRAES
jgi:hypothetical protein